MPVGTVRGRFELDGNALRALKDLQQQGIKTQAQFKAAAEELDKIGDRSDMERLRKYREFSRSANQSIRQQWKLTANTVERDANRMNRSIDGVIARMQVLGSITARPEIDLSGVATAMTQLEAIQRRMNSLGRSTARPRVLSGGLRGGGGGGVFRGGAPAVGGGGDRGGVLRSMNLGPFTVNPRPFMGGLALGLPAVSSLGGAAVGLGGSLGYAGAGLGALGLSGAGGLAAGLGSIMAIASPAAKGIGEARDAMTKYTEAVADFGRRSTEARNAKRELDQAMASAPRGTRDLLREWDTFSTGWRRETRPGREAFVGAARSGVGALQRATPWLSQQVNLNAGVAATQADRLFDFMSGREGRQGVTAASQIFRGNLGNVRGAGENAFSAWTNVMQASRPFFRESTEWLEKWTGGWKTGTDDIDETRRSIERMEKHLKGAGRFTRELWETIRDLGRYGAGSGLNLLDRMTGQLQDWQDQMARNPAQVRQFFRESVNSTVEMGRAIRELVQGLHELSEVLRPILDSFSRLVTLAGSLGMLQPGALAAGLGAYRGMRGAMRGGAAAGGAGAALSGGALGGAAAGYGGVRGAWGAVRGAGMYGTGVRAGMRGMAGTYGVARSFGYGRAASMGAAAGGTTAGGLLSSAARGAGRAFLPIGVGLAALDMLTFQGNLGQRAQAAASNIPIIGDGPLGIGVIDRPKTPQEMDDRASQYAMDAMEGLGRGRTGRGLRRDIAQLQRMRGSIGGNDAVDLGTGDERTRRIKEIRAAFNEELRIRRQMNRELDARKDATSRERAGRMQRDLGKAYDIRAAKEGPEAAMQHTVGRVLDMQRELRPAGAKVLAQNTLAWARAQARANPKLLDEYKQLRRGVMRNFSQTGADVQVVNNRIFRTTKDAWKNIRQSIVSEAERARQEGTAALTRLQREAVQGLIDMGFTRGQAAGLIRSQDPDASAKQRRAGSQIMSMHNSGQKGPVQNEGLVYGRDAKARGGRLRGLGRQDNVPLAGGGLGAPGEVVLTGHQERYLNRLINAAGFRTSVEDITKQITTRHADPPPIGALKSGMRGRGHKSPPGYQGGGRIVPIPWAPGERINSSILPLVTRLHQRYGVHVSDAYGPGHVSAGHTQFGTSVDFVPGSSGWDGVDRVAAWAVGQGYQVLYDGRLGTTAYPNHGRGHHLHVTFGSRGARGNVPMGGAAAGMGQQLQLSRQRASGRGVPGAMAQRSMDVHRRGLEQIVNRRIGGMGGGGGLGGFTGGGGGSRANMRLGRRMMTAFGWGAGEWPALRELWTRESGWRASAHNPSSGAHGIPQSLPASKMASAGADYMTNPVTQIKWGLNYIKDRYGSPSAALSFHNSHNWYQRGGRIDYAGAFARGGAFTTRGPTMFMAGEHGREHVRVARTRAGMGGGGFGRVSVSFAGAKFIVRNNDDIEKIADAVAGKILKVLD